MAQQDSILESLIDKYKQRSELGIKKYNTTLDRTDLSMLDWINHAQDEAMDLSLYLEKIKTIIAINKDFQKEHLEKAWMDGFDFNSNYKDFEDYYNQNYNQ